MANIQYPLFGICYNWKGLKEENYLYTTEELKRFDPDLYWDCVQSPDEWHDSTLADCGWKTWMATKIDNERQLRAFISGGYNDTEREAEDEDWYWENSLDNDLYGERSDTMKNVLNELN